MKKLLFCPVVLTAGLTCILFLFSSKTTLGEDATGNPSVSSTFNLNGKWKASIEDKHGTENYRYSMVYEVVQKGFEIKMINTLSGSEVLGTVKNNSLHLEPSISVGMLGKYFFPARKYNISQDGKAMTSDFDYTWESGTRKGTGTMAVEVRRE